MKMKTTNKPAYEIRLNHIRVSVWANSSERGTWFNTVLTRRYKDGEEWKDSNSFSGMADLALVAEGVRLARDFIARAETDAEQMSDAEIDE
jgi:hypothetical protein